jgi:hypothetical protein
MHALSSSTTTLLKKHTTATPSGTVPTVSNCREKSPFVSSVITTTSNIPIPTSYKSNIVTSHVNNHHHIHHQNLNQHQGIENDLKSRNLSNERSPCHRATAGTNAAAALSAATQAAAAALANTRKQHQHQQQQYAQQVQNLSPIKPSFVK